MFFRLKGNLGPETNPDHELYSEVEIVCRVLITALPVMWSLGMLPQVEPGILWLLEQANIFLLGGSTMSSPATLVMSVAVGSTCSVGIFFIRNTLVRACAAAASGYFCSLGFGEEFLACMGKSPVGTQVNY
jgi:hypothetical protein